MQTPIFPSTPDLDMLVKELDEQFPDRMPELGLSEKEKEQLLKDIEDVAKGTQGITDNITVPKEN